MNISHEHKVIWWTKPEMGEKLVLDSLKFLNFVTHTNLTKKSIPITKEKISFTTKIPEGCENYSLILSTRNPYFQVINYYLRTSEINWYLKGQSKDFFIENLNRWVLEIFSVDPEVLLTTDNNLQQVLPYNLTKKIPDFVIKYEKIKDCLNEIGFLMTERINFNENLLKNNIEFEIDTLSLESATKIYKVYKKSFDFFDYDPFSFTSHELSLKEKVDFIHN